MSAKYSLLSLASGEKVLTLFETKDGKPVRVIVPQLGAIVNNVYIKKIKSRLQIQLNY